jgi:hypothetical protein
LIPPKKWLIQLSDAAKKYPTNWLICNFVGAREKGIIMMSDKKNDEYKFI